jgi:hypothetical protein
MHTVELLTQALKTAERLGYGIRQEWLGGTGGGACSFSGRKWIFVDLALNPVEQLDRVVKALKDDPQIYSVELSAGIACLLELPAAASRRVA